MDVNAIINLTQHPATPEQIAAGVVDHPNRAAVQAALTVDELPSKAGIIRRCFDLADLAKGMAPP